MDMKLNKGQILNENELSDVVGGSCQINTSGSGYAVSGNAPMFGVGEVVRIRYYDSYGGNYKAKCSIRGVGGRNGGMSGQEFTYTIQIVWLPGSCPAVGDVGRTYYNVAESCLFRG